MRSAAVAAAACLFVCCLTLLPPAPVLAAEAPTLYSGGGMVLQLEIQNRTGDTRGLLYTKETVYRFLARRFGMELKSDEIFARNERSAPFRKISGSVDLRIAEAGQKVTLEMHSPGRTLSAVFRPQLDPRIYHMLSRFGDSYCDAEQLVFLLPDSGGEEGGGWLSKVVGSSQATTLGLYFGSDAWYHFVAEGDLSSGLSSSRVMVGSGAEEGSLEGAKVRATTDAGRLQFVLTGSAGSKSVQLPFQTGDRACSKAVMRWTAKRRLPPQARIPTTSGRPAPERKEEKPAVPIAAPAPTKEAPRPEVKTQPEPVQQAPAATESVAPVPQVAPPAQSERVAPPASRTPARMRDRGRLREAPSKDKGGTLSSPTGGPDARVTEPEATEELPEQELPPEEGVPEEQQEEGQ